MADDARHPHRWGYADTRLELDGPRSVRMTGSRYLLSGQRMPHLIPFVEQMLGVPFDPGARIPETTPAIPAPRLNAALLTTLEQLLPADRRSTDPRVRLGH